MGEKGLISMQTSYAELAGGSEKRITRQDVYSELEFRGKVLIFLVHFVIFKFPFKTKHTFAIF